MPVLGSLVQGFRQLPSRSKYLPSVELVCAGIRCSSVNMTQRFKQIHNLLFAPSLCARPKNAGLRNHAFCFQFVKRRFTDSHPLRHVACPVRVSPDRVRTHFLYLHSSSTGGDHIASCEFLHRVCAHSDGRHSISRKEHSYGLLSTWFPPRLGSHFQVNEGNKARL